MAARARRCPTFAADPRALTSMYEEMLALRLFDAKAVALQRTGRLGTYAACLGQEATAVGIGRAMAREDVLLGTYRETGTMLARGVRMAEILLYWSGDERGSAYAGPGAEAGFSDLRADRDACAASRRRRLCVQAASRTARGGLRSR